MRGGLHLIGDKLGGMASGFSIVSADSPIGLSEVFRDDRGSDWFRYNHRNPWLMLLSRF